MEAVKEVDDQLDVLEDQDHIQTPLTIASFLTGLGSCSVLVSLGINEKLGVGIKLHVNKSLNKSLFY